MMMNASDNSTDNENIQATSKLEAHINWFADEDGWVSTTSVEEGLKKLNDSPTTAYYKARGIMFFSGLSTKGCPFRQFRPKEGVGALNHARDTKLFNADGSINEDQWLMLCSHSESHLGTQIITKTQFYAFLNGCRAADTRADYWPHIAEKASNGEWHDLFEKCTDYWKQTDDGYEACLTLATLRKFYDDSPAVFDDVVAGKLPVPRPGQ